MNYIKRFLDYTASYSKSGKREMDQKQKMDNTYKNQPVLDLKTVSEPKKNSYEKVFLNDFNKLINKHRPLEVWTDFVTMFACAISNAIDKRDDLRSINRENMYLTAINKYDKEERDIFPKLCADVTMALEENSEQDFLGRIYMTLGLGNKYTQQFFTPYNICELMAEITMDNIVEDVKKHGYLSVNDPCCGAGATLIAAANVAKKKLQIENINFQEKISFVAQDIDFTVAMMCYIQLSLLGVCGYVKVGNSLTDPITSNDNKDAYWFTPIYFSNIWYCRRIIDKLDRKELTYRIPKPYGIEKEIGINGKT